MNITYYKTTRSETELTKKYNLISQNGTKNDTNKFVELNFSPRKWPLLGTDLSYMTHMLNQVPYTSEVWSKYDNLANILEDDPAEAKYNIIKDNVIYNSNNAILMICTHQPRFITM